MMLFIPDDKKNPTPLWWNSERYDYCDMIMKKEDENNLFNRFIKKLSHLFA